MNMPVFRPAPPAGASARDDAVTVTAPPAPRLAIARAAPSEYYVIHDDPPHGAAGGSTVRARWLAMFESEARALAWLQRCPAGLPANHEESDLFARLGGTRPGFADAYVSVGRFSYAARRTDLTRPPRPHRTVAG